MAVDAAAARARLEAARRDHARAEGEHQTLKGDLEQTRVRLRELLGCEPGQEKGALAELRQQAGADQIELERVLAEAEQASTAREIQGHG